MAMTAMSIATAVGTGFNEDFQKGVMDRFRTLPIGQGSVLFAKIVVELMRMLVATTILMIVGVLVGFDITNWPGNSFASVGLSVLFGSSLMWIFLVLGVTMKNAQSVQAMGFLVLMPLQFGSSIFSPTRTMPGWLQNFTDYNPLSALADTTRGLMVGGPVTHSLWVTLAWTAGLTLVMAPIAIHKFPHQELTFAHRTTKTPVRVPRSASHEGGGLLQGEPAALGVRGLVRRVVQHGPYVGLRPCAHLVLHRAHEAPGRQQLVGGPEQHGRVADAAALVQTGEGDGCGGQMRGGHVRGDHLRQRVARPRQRLPHLLQGGLVQPLERVQPGLDAHHEPLEDHEGDRFEVLAQDPHVFACLGDPAAAGHPHRQEQPGGGHGLVVGAVAALQEAAAATARRVPCHRTR